MTNNSIHTLAPNTLDAIFDGDATILTTNKVLECIGVNFTLQGGSLEEVSKEDLWKVITFLLYRQAAADTLQRGSHEQQMQSM